MNNPHLIRLLARNPRQAVPMSFIGALVDSMNACDVTRSYELAPSRRLASQAAYRRALRQVCIVLFVFAALVAFIAAFASPKPPSSAIDPPANAGGGANR
jgi:hypothetical protein